MFSDLQLDTSAPPQWTLLVRVGKEVRNARNDSYEKVLDPEKYISTLLVKASASKLSTEDKDVMQGVQRCFQDELTRPYEPWSTHYQTITKHTTAENPVDWTKSLKNSWKISKGKSDLPPSLKMAFETTAAQAGPSASALNRDQRETDDLQAEVANKDTRSALCTITPSDNGAIDTTRHAWRSQRKVLSSFPEKSVPANKLLVIYEDTVIKYDQLWKAKWHSIGDPYPNELELSNDTFREVVLQCQPFVPFSGLRPLVSGTTASDIGLRLGLDGAPLGEV
ncbi:MAG: hypothetical protein TREMPRED_002639 [Tremellales sp. Tagirdzhanova-0007]|nr:MAG: hypothetical protein TREMPRED_002639 [Tremellales sp. Tagirdzhanova-0007]